MLKVKTAILIFTCVMSGVLLAGCYQQPINQGNRLEQTAVERLKVGMTKEQVRYLLGAPILQEPFDQSRWNYVYRYKTKTGDYKQRTIILHFNGDTLAQMTGDVAQKDVPDPEKPAHEQESEEAPIL